MDLARHCDLCEFQITTLKEGTTCKLTEEKPEFNNTCSKIELNEKFRNKLKSINIEYEKIKQEKVLTFIYFGVFLLIGISAITGGYLLGKYAFEGGIISTVPLIIMGVGLSPIGMAFGTLNNYRQKMEIAKINKNKIDEVLNLYKIDYEIDIKFGKEYHGTKEISAEIKIRGN
jgi:hypothetical protein